jgi:hypothetical protein
MKFSTQRHLPLSLSPRNSSAVTAPGPRTVNWQSRAPERVGAVGSIIQLAPPVRSPRAPRATQLLTKLPAQLPAQDGPSVDRPSVDRPSVDTGGQLPGATFGRARLLHAIEVFGSCMMIAAFLVLALFG